MTHAHESEPDSASWDSERLLSRRLLRRLVPVSDMTIWRWERDGRFPHHLSINGRNYWRLGEVRAWLEGQPRGRVPSAQGDGG